MKNKNLLLLISIVFFAIASCTKEGSQGPQGEQGDTGATGGTGVAGPAGPSGVDGSVIYSGTGAPSATIGNLKDYYLDRSTGNLYGPKTASGWGNPLTLIGATGAQGSTGATGSTGSQGPKGATGATGATGAQGPTGPAGPKGAIGATGATGANGTNGTNGTNGSQVYSGTAAPAAAFGRAGDYFLDKTTYLLYGPKSATGWGTPILLKGAQGAQGPAGPAGADGSTIFSGTSAPDISLGQNGDYYFNKSTGGLYGPKTVAGWGGPTSLVGPAGATGATGGTGATGATGTNGTNGVDGNKILNGTTAPSTALGNNGDYYLDKTSFNFYGPKTASGWGTPTLLRGAQGAQGPTGPAGADGSVIFSGTGAPAPALGNTGDYYFDKTSSLFYGPKTGSGWGTGTSLKGTNGTNGSNGSNGTNGANGTNGSAVLSGTGVPAAATGNDGDFYIDITTYKIYGPKAAGAWGSGTSLKGPAGNANVLAFETPDTYLFNWVYGGYDAVANSNSSYLRINRGGNDTTTYFNIPASALAAAKTGTIAVYLRNTGTTTTWQPVPFSIGNGDYVLAYNFKLTTLSASAFVRISVTYASNSSFINVDKVRIVIIPASTAGVLNVARPGMPLRQTMQKFNLADTDFKTLK